MYICVYGYLSLSLFLSFLQETVKQYHEHNIHEQQQQHTSLPYCKIAVSKLHPQKDPIARKLIFKKTKHIPTTVQEQWKHTMFTYHAHVQLVSHAQTTPFLNEEHKYQVESMYALTEINEWKKQKD